MLWSGAKFNFENMMGLWVAVSQKNYAACEFLNWFWVRSFLPSIIHRFVNGLGSHMGKLRLTTFATLTRESCMQAALYCRKMAAPIGAVPWGHL